MVFSAFYAKWNNVSIANILLPFSAATYLLFMYRIGGPDYNNYSKAFAEPSLLIIPDVGFQFLTKIAHYLGVTFTTFSLLFGFYSIFVYHRLAKHFDVNSSILLMILLCHLFVVRDFSQIRIAFAICLILHGWLYGNKFSLIFYAIAIAMHLASLTLIGIIFCSYLVNKTKQKLGILILFATTVSLIGHNLEKLSYFDPRISTYISWDAENYGQPVSGFGHSILIIFLLIVKYYFLDKRFRIFDIISTSLILALTISLSTRDYAIFSYRITNIAISFYPIVIAGIFSSTRPYSLKSVAIGTYFYSVITREQTLDVISSIVSPFFNK